MTLSSNIWAFVRNCANEKNVQLFKAGAKAGNAITLALADDIHQIATIAVKSEKGIGFALLQNFFPSTSETVKKQDQRMNDLEMQLFPQLPQASIVYEGKVTKAITINSDEYGYEVVLETMKPAYTFYVHDPKMETLPEELPETICASLVDEKKKEWALVEKTDDMCIYSHVA